jgi:uncharacterized cupredoxin-like copper-binding protein
MGTDSHERPSGPMGGLDVLKFVFATALTALIASPALAADVSTTSGSAGTVINVTLSDMGHDMDLSKNGGLGIGMKGDMSKAMMKIDADKFAVPAGLVTFKVTNASANMEHEMVVVPIANMSTPLPYKDAENTVDEEAAKAIGEVPELAPAKSGEATMELKPGLYALVCNVPGHYANGMWRVIAVQ